MKRKTADNEDKGNDDIEEAFKVFDRNNDGWVTLRIASAPSVGSVTFLQETMTYRPTDRQTNRQA